MSSKADRTRPLRYKRPALASLGYDKPKQVERSKNMPNSMEKQYQYTAPGAAGCLLEAEACKLVIKELDRIVEKLKRKIDREAQARQKEFAAIMEYSSESEIQDAYGYAMITERQYHHYLDIFREGETALENHAPTKSERACQILCHISKDLAAEQREWEFSALSPEQKAQELARQDAALQSWKEYLKGAKARLHDENKEGGA